MEGNVKKKKKEKDKEKEIKVPRGVAFMGLGKRLSIPERTPMGKGEP